MNDSSDTLPAGCPLMELPTELQREVVETLASLEFDFWNERISCLQALRLVNRRLRDITTPILFKEIEVKLWGDGGDPGTCFKRLEKDVNDREFVDSSDIFHCPRKLSLSVRVPRLSGRMSEIEKYNAIFPTLVGAFQDAKELELELEIYTAWDATYIEPTAAFLEMACAFGDRRKIALGMYGIVGEHVASCFNKIRGIRKMKLYGSISDDGQMNEQALAKLILNNQLLESVLLGLEDLNLDLVLSHTELEHMPKGLKELKITKGHPPHTVNSLKKLQSVERLKLECLSNENRLERTERDEMWRSMQEAGIHLKEFEVDMLDLSLLAYLEWNCNHLTTLWISLPHNTSHVGVDMEAMKKVSAGFWGETLPMVLPTLETFHLLLNSGKRDPDDSEVNSDGEGLEIARLFSIRKLEEHIHQYQPRNLKRVLLMMTGDYFINDALNTLAQFLSHSSKLSTIELWYMCPDDTQLEEHHVIDGSHQVVNWVPTSHEFKRDIQMQLDIRAPGLWNLEYDEDHWVHYLRRPDEEFVDAASCRNACFVYGRDAWAEMPELDGTKYTDPQEEKGEAESEEDE